MIRRVFFCCSALGGLPIACHAGDAIPQALPPQSTQIMIYFRQPMWSPGAHRTYGLRIDQASAPLTVPNAVGFNPLRRQEIFNFEIGPHADMRVEFGRRLVWDLNRQELALGSLRPGIPILFAPRSTLVADAPRPPP
jgi:hypothetical protein